ncbi:MAG TPA: hypothetical protein VLJ37_12265 [bacterium]|nr:hypothetical protein [bacterium]
MVCNGSFMTPALGGTNTMVQMFYQLSAGALNDATGLPMSIPLRIPDTIDLSILANADARKCFGDLIKGAGSEGLTKNVVEIEGELYAFLTGKDPSDAETADIVAAFQGAQGKTITKDAFITAYCGEDAKGECDAARLGAQPLVAYVESMKAAVDPSYKTPNQRRDEAVKKASEKLAQSHEAEKAEIAQERDDAALLSNIFMGTTGGLGAVVLYLGLRAVWRRWAANRTVVENAHPAAQVAVQSQLANMADQGMPPAPRAPVERRETRVNPPIPAATAAPAPPPEEIAVALADLENEGAARGQT